MEAENGVKAWLGESCEGCPYVFTETERGTNYHRCGAAGEKQGYIVGVKRFTPWIPAWCPRKEKEEHGGIR